MLCTVAQRQTGDQPIVDHFGTGPSPTLALPGKTGAATQIGLFQGSRSRGRAGTALVSILSLASTSPQILCSLQSGERLYTQEVATHSRLSRPSSDQAVAAPPAPPLIRVQLDHQPSTC